MNRVLDFSFQNLRPDEFGVLAVQNFNSTARRDRTFSVGTEPSLTSTLESVYVLISRDLLQSGLVNASPEQGSAAVPSQKLIYTSSYTDGMIVHVICDPLSVFQTYDSLCTPGHTLRRLVLLVYSITTLDLQTKIMQATKR